MASLTIYELDDGVAERLRARAREGARSLEQEAAAILQTALLEVRPHGGRRLLQTIREEFGPLGGVELDLPPRVAYRDPPRFDDE